MTSNTPRKPDMKLKYLIPEKWRLRLRLFQRTLSDALDQQAVFATAGTDIDCPFSVCEKQIIRPGKSYEGKLHNLQLAAEKINRVTIGSGETFSFWRVIGKPDHSNGYRKSRSLVSGSLAESYGGGLCQIAGILYYLSLKGCLEIAERYHHSMDIYTEEERYAPLGSDATVVYGYKDLRIRNPYSFPVRFRLDTDGDILTCCLQSTKRIVPEEVLFRIEHQGSMVEVITVRNGSVINRSAYRKNH